MVVCSVVFVPHSAGDSLGRNLGKILPHRGAHWMPSMECRALNDP